jgi:hypothetical protein
MQRKRRAEMVGAYAGRPSWHELGVDSREGEALRYGTRDLPTREVLPFKLPGSRTKYADAEFSHNTIEERIRTRVWMELTPEEARESRYMCRELIHQDSDWRRTSVSDLSHLSKHWDAHPTKLDSCCVFQIPKRMTTLQENKKGEEA